LGRQKKANPMTHPKEAKHLSDKEKAKAFDELVGNLKVLTKEQLSGREPIPDKRINQIKEANKYGEVEPAYYNAVCNQAKAHNTIKAERDALYALIENDKTWYLSELKEYSVEDVPYPTVAIESNRAVLRAAANIITQAQTIKNKDQSNG